MQHECHRLLPPPVIDKGALAVGTPSVNAFCTLALEDCRQPYCRVVELSRTIASSAPGSTFCYCNVIVAPTEDVPHSRDPETRQTRSRFTEPAAVAMVRRRDRKLCSFK